MDCGVTIEVCNDSPPSDPQTHPVLIVGSISDVKRLRFEEIVHKFGKRVSPTAYQSGIDSLHPKSSDSVSMYLNYATVATVPDSGTVSRHYSSCRPLSWPPIFRSHYTGAPLETIVIILGQNKSDCIPIASAIGRSFPLYSRKTPAKSGGTLRVEFYRSGVCLSDSELLNGLNYLINAVRLSARIVDMPCSEMNVSQFIQEIKTVADSDKQFSMTVIKGEELKGKGFGGIHSVGKSSADLPALVTLTYTSRNPKPEVPVIALVGKAIVYDTGGLSLKTKTAMPGMKRDCGGAAGILGAMALHASLGYSGTLHAVFCIAENCISPIAIRPDDIITLYSGRTIEVNNTDAEGRLVLADGVAYAKKDLKAKIILDMATLTGAQAITTGKHHAAILSSQRDWEFKTFIAGLNSGDLTFPIPFCPELLLSEFNSSVADMKNSVNDRSNAQSSCAGLFVFANSNLDEEDNWIHVDMAGPVHSGERATGYGVSLLLLLFGEWSLNSWIVEFSKEIPHPYDGDSKKFRV